MNPILECIDLTKKFGTKEALSEVNCQLPRGRIIGLLGPNGSGKSTLVRTVTRALTPTAGRVLLDGRDLRRLRPRELARLLAVVAQE